MTVPTAASGDRPYGVAGRIVRVVLGAVALVGGAGGTILSVVLLFTGIADLRAAALPWKGFAAAALALLIAGLFAGLGWMGWKRVAAGIRGQGSQSEAASQEADRLCFYVSRRTRSLLAASLVGLLVCALVFAIVGVGFWTALAGAAVVLSIVVALARTPERSCSFCGVARSKLTLLVAGPAASMCDQCAVAALGEFSKHFADRDETGEWCGKFLRALPSRCPRAISRPFLEQIVGKQRTAAGIRNAVWWCFKFDNGQLARELLEDLPEAERQPTDWLNLGVALGEEGRFAEALAATERAGAGGDEQRPWVLGNSAWFRSRLKPDATAEERALWLRDVEEAQQLIGSRRPAGWERVMASFRGTEAELRRLGGDFDTAMQVLQRAEAEQPLTGAHLVIRAQVLASLGRSPEARESIERALALLHPEELVASEARRLLASLGS